MTMSGERSASSWNRDSLSVSVWRSSSLVRIDVCSRSTEWRNESPMRPGIGVVNAALSRSPDARASVLASSAERLATTSLNAAVTIATSYGPSGSMTSSSIVPELTVVARAARRPSGLTIVRTVTIDGRGAEGGDQAQCDEIELERALGARLEVVCERGDIGRRRADDLSEVLHEEQTVAEWSRRAAGCSTSSCSPGGDAMSPATNFWKACACVVGDDETLLRRRGLSRGARFLSRAAACV